MKKFFLYSLMLATSIGFVSCEDKDDVSELAQREFMTLFRCENNTGKSSDPYACSVVDLNDVHLYWYGVDGCAGYQIRWALQPNAAAGPEGWKNCEENGLLVGDIIIDDPNTLDYVVKDLQYSTAYYFAIRTLHSLDVNDPLNSNWYGYGTQRQWADYLSLTTGIRYAVPYIIQKSNITKTSFRINLNRAISGYSATQMEGFDEHFSEDGTNFKVDYLAVSASPSSPNAKVPTEFTRYELSDEDWERGYVDIEGLNENSVYIVNVYDKDIAVAVDASYNTLAVRTKGDAGAPIRIEWNQEKFDTTSQSPLVTRDITKYNVTRLDKTFEDYMVSMELAENQHFYLEGGKNYYFRNNLSIYKGFTLETDPADIAAGKGRATVYLGGLSQNGTSVTSNNFMVGRQPQTGEDPTITIDIDSICFKNIDFGCPLATNYGQVQDGTNKHEGYTDAAVSTGNYFSNMYSNGMGFNLAYWLCENCSFQGMVRGFFRVQGSQAYVIDQFTIRNCEFLNCGYYDNNGAGYAWMAGAGNTSQTKINIFKKVLWEENTIYDCPRTALFTDNNKAVNFDASVQWDITLRNNTIVNWSTRSTGRPIFNIRYVPGGSTLTCENNFFMLLKQPGDANRKMNFAGSDVRTIQGGDGSGIITIKFKNNWSTNDNLTAGQVFSASAFNATSNSLGKHYKSGAAVAPEGYEIDLAVKVVEKSATEIMENPLPPTTWGTTPTGKDHHVDNLDGLKFKTTVDELKGVGASKWQQ